MRHLFFTTLILLAFANAKAQDSTKGASYTLQQAVDYALKNQTRITNAMIDEELAQARANEIRGIGLPQVNGSFDVKDFIEQPTSLIPGEFFGGPAGSFIPVKFGTKYNATAGIDASQMIFDGGYLVGLQATKVFLDLSKKNTQRTKIEASLNVTKAYYTVLVSEERMKLLNTNLDRIKKLKEDTRVLNENGFVEKVDLDRIEVTYNNLVVEKDKIQRFLNLGYSLLKYQMGLDQSQVITLTDKLESITFETKKLTEEKFEYSKRIEYSLLETQRKGAMLQLRKDRYGYLPNIIAYGSVNASAQRNEFNVFDKGYRWYPTALIGARVGVPIFSGLQKHYKIQQTKLSLLKLDNDQKFLQQSIDLELKNTLTNLENSSMSLDIQKKNIVLAEDVYRVSKIKYEQGVGSNLEVLTAETALKEAQTNYYSALYDALIAKAEYEKATGNLIK